MFRFLMRRTSIMPLEELIESARDLGVRFVWCGVSTTLMGIREHELLRGIETGGVATYLDATSGSQVSLFI